MSARAALLQAAEHIESAPGRYGFMETETPGDEAGLACVLGWAGYFAGMPAGTRVENVARELFGMTEAAFYTAMLRLSPPRARPKNILRFWESDWHYDRTTAAVAMRRLATELAEAA
jgi:hypothetical protein